MNGRVLSEDEWQTIEDQFNSECGEVKERVAKRVPDLIATIRDRDKTIAKLKEKRDGICADYIGEYKEENAILLEALERISRVGYRERDESQHYSGEFHAECLKIARETVTKVKDGEA